MGFNTDFVYHFRTEGKGYEFGDSLAYNVSAGYRLLPAVYGVYPARNHLNAYLELNGTSSRKDLIRGAGVPDTGGNLIFLSPGIQLIPGNFLVEASLRLPVFQELKGTQLKFRPGFNVGVRWLLY